jgi:hypothetical protein
MFNPRCFVVFHPHVVVVFGMRVFKFLECNPFGSITHVLPFNLQYKKLALQCSSKCDDTFCTTRWSQNLEIKKLKYIIWCFLYYDVCIIEHDFLCFYLLDLIWTIVYFSYILLIIIGSVLVETWLSGHHVFVGIFFFKNW